MKTLFISALLGVVMLQSCMSKHIAASEVPSAVTTAFNTEFPKATDVIWDKETTENQTIYYKAKFKVNGKKSKAQYNQNGNTDTNGK